MKSNCLEKRQNELRNLINDNFGFIKYPGDQRIVCMTYEGDTERMIFYKAYRGRHWKDVPDDAIRKNNEIPFFTEEGFYFYLPKFLLTLVSHCCEEPYNIAFDALLFALTVPKKIDAWRSGCFERLSRAQKIVVARVLAFYANEVPEQFRVVGADKALTSYWARFLENNST